jgi:hypothetical protein
MQQGRYARVVDAIFRQQEPHLRGIVLRGLDGDLSLEADEVKVFLNSCFATFLNFEDTFLQHESGTLDSSSWPIAAMRLKGFLAAPGLSAAWSELRGRFGNAYVEAVDKMASEASLAEPGDAATSWKASVVAEKERIRAST